MVEMFGVKCSYFLLILISFCLKFCSVCANDKTDPVPTSYDVVLRANMKNMIFDGEVIIGVHMLRTENKITLKSQGLVIKSVNVKYAGVMSVQETHTTDLEDERLIIKVDHLIAGNHTIHIHFQGRINDRSVGFFSSACRSETTTSWIAGVYLEPVNARAIFPSFDVNEHRIPLNLELILDQNYNILTPISRSEVTSSRNISLKFDAIHLDQVGWAYYPKDQGVHVESKYGYTVVTCRRNNWQWLVKDIAEEMSNYTNVEATAPQWIMMPDLPTPFASSKNIIFIREMYLENSTYINNNDYKTILLTLSEAYAQQLFGQIIRFDSWTEIWLTKGLANFISYKIAEKLDTNFISDSYIIGNVMPKVLERESIPHSLSNHAHSKQDVLSLYDPDLFNRAGLIMRMLEEQIGQSAFRRVVRNFVKATNGFGLANRNHFWSSLKESSLDFPENVPIEEVMKAWINSSGYPLVNVKKVGNYLHISQDSIFKNKGRDDKGYWWIPITVTSRSIRVPRKFWLRPHGNLRINIPLSDNWYMINENGKGFYRVNYDLENWRNLSEAITKKELKGITRARLLDDILGLAESGYLPYAVSLEFTKHLADEYEGSPNLTPWSAAVRHLVTVRSLLKDSKKPHFDDYASKLIEFYIFGNYSIADYASVELLMTTANNQTDNQTAYQTENSVDLVVALNKLSQIKELCRDNIYCLDIINYFQMITTDNSGLIENFFATIKCFEIEKGSTNETLVNDWLNVYTQYKSASYETKIMEVLSCLKNDTQKYRLLEMFFNEKSGLKRQDFFNVIAGLSYSETSVDNLLKWMSANMQRLKNYVSGDISMVSNILTKFSEKIYSEDVISRFRSVTGALEKINGTSSHINKHQIHRAMLRIEMNKKRREEHSKEITKWLQNRNEINSIIFSSSNNAKSILTLTLISFVLSISRYHF